MVKIDAGNTAWVLVSAALVLFMTPGPRVVLRRHGAGQARARDAHAELLRDGDRHRLVDDLRLLARVRRLRQRRMDRQLRLRRVEGHDQHRHEHRDPDARVRRVPADVRGDHARADHRRDRRPHALGGVGRLHHHLVDTRVPPGRALGVRGRLARQARRARLRGRHGRARERGCGCARARVDPRPPARVGPRRRCRRTRCRSRCSAPASSGSAGSASTRARRSRPTVWRRRRS